MSNNMRNEGIYITGGSLQADQVAVGRNAQATKILSTADETLERKGLTEIRDRLDELLKAITVHTDDLNNPDEVLDSTEIVAKELAKDEPNKLTIMGVLNGVAACVKPVASIATAAEALGKAVMLFL
jgi:hypothetical protein